MAFAELIKKALQDPDAADFSELRRAYAQSPEHDPYAQKDELPGALARLREAVAEEDDGRVAEAAEAVLALNPALLGPRMTASVAHERLGEVTRAEAHRRFIRGWLGALVAAGDGRSMETAFPVLSLDEEYALLQFAGWERLSRRTTEENGHAFDVFEARRPDDGTLAVLCFNIDLIVRSIQEGRGVLPPSGEPEMRMDVSRPGRHRLRLTLQLDAVETEATVHTRIAGYLEGIGYRRIDAAHYRRGSRWGSLTSLTPRGWQAVVTTEVAPKNGGAGVRAYVDVNTFGQQVIPPEVEFWQAEATGLADAVLTGRVDADTPTAYAGRARRAGILTLIILLGGGVLVTLVGLAVSGVMERWVPGASKPIFSATSDDPVLGVIIIVAILAYAAFSIWRRRRKR